MDIRVQFVEQFKVAAGEGAAVELRLRLLADKLPSLQHLAHAQKLENIEKEVAIHFATKLTKEEKEILALCRELRNKILHCNFSVARERLNDLGAKPQSGCVRKIDLGSMGSSGKLAKLEQAILQKQGSLVSEAPTKQPGSVCGWLLEAGNAGDFTAAATAFRNAAAIVDRLAEESCHGA